MARYQIGDRVTAFNRNGMLRPRDGQIVEIRHDGELTGTESSYTFYRDGDVATRVRGYEIRDHHIMVVLERANNIQDPMAGAVPVPVDIPAPHPEPNEDDNDEENDREQPAVEQELQVRFINAIDWNELNNQWGNAQEIPRNRNQELLDGARAHIENYRFNGLLPLDFIVVGDTVRPVFRSQDFHRNINIYDYDGRVDRERYFTYTIGDITLHPMHDRHINRINYYDDITGENYTNQYRDVTVIHQGVNRLRDNLAVQWCRTRFLQENGVGQPITTAVLKKKRKLRRKYKEMPKIREEKYYAGKEFIA